MTTIKLYEKDVTQRELTTTILRLDSYKDYPALVLAETIFFPEGGGQPWDLGTIDSIPIIGVVEDNGVIYHLFDSHEANISSFSPENPVHCVLDWARRFDHMQRHCGEHILSGVFFRDCGGVNRGFHMGNEYMTIDISLEHRPEIEAITWDMAMDAEMEGNRVIWQNVPVTTKKFLHREDASGIPLRKELAIDEDITIVCVGEPNNPSDCVACCGTHPTTSGQVGLLKIYKVEHYKGMFRIYFEAGERALADYRLKHQLITTLGKKYSAGQDDLAEKLNARESKNNLIREGFYKLRQSVIESRQAEIMEEASRLMGKSVEALSHDALQSTMPKVPMIVRVYDDLPGDDLLTIGRGITGKFKGLLILHYPTEHTLFLFSDGKPDCGKLVRDHLDIYNGKGGGNPTASRIIFSKAEYPDFFIDLLEKHLR